MATEAITTEHPILRTWRDEDLPPFAEMNADGARTCRGAPFLCDTLHIPREAGPMAKASEFRVTIEDKPGALGKCFLALASRGVNVLAFQSYVEERESLVRFVADDPARAREVLGGLRMNFEVTEVALVRLPHRPGELGRAAAKLGEGQINIDYSYCGVEPGSPPGILVFGVDNVTKASSLLDQLAAEKPAS